MWGQKALSLFAVEVWIIHTIWQHLSQFKNTYIYPLKFYKAIHLRTVYFTVHKLHLSENKQNLKNTFTFAPL